MVAKKHAEDNRLSSKQQSQFLFGRANERVSCDTFRMCEFCLDPTSPGVDKDSKHQDFAGFFCATAIEAAIGSVNAGASAEHGDDESEVAEADDPDGT